MSEKPIIKILTMEIKTHSYIKGGSQIKYIELIQECLKHNWEIHHIAPGHNTISKSLLFFHHPVRDIPILPASIPFSIQAIFQFYKISRKITIDAVVTNSFIEGLIGIAFKAQNKNLKVIVSIHGDHIEGIQIENYGIKKIVYTSILQSIEKIVLCHSDKIIFVSEYNRSTILARNGFHNVNKTTLLYNNIPEKIQNNESKSIIRYSNEKKIIGYVGSLHARGKGLTFLIKALKCIKEKIPNTMLVLVGDGPDKDALISLIEDLDLTDDVVFTGFKEDPVPYMKGFDILVLPSLHEACSLVLLEGLGLNIPVLGSKVGGTREILQYEELLFEPSDINAISRKVLHFFLNLSANQKVAEYCMIRKKIFLFNWGDEMLKIIQDTVNQNDIFANITEESKIK